METFSKLHFVPAPTLDSSKQHYNKFEDLYGSKPTEKDKPSLNFSLEVIEEDKRNKTTLVSRKVRDVVKCSVCHRPRCVYANTELNTHLKSALTEIKDNGDYACGGTLVADEDPRRYSFIVRRELACHMSIEVAYYVAKCVSLPPVCFYCGGVSGGPLADDEAI